MSDNWKTLDTKKTLERKRQQETTSGSVGAYVVPLGAEPMRPAVKIEKRKKKSKK